MELARAEITLEDLMHLPADARVEVVEGEITELKPIGILHHLIVGNIYSPIDRYVLANDPGAVFFHGLMYLLHHEPSLLRGARVPDVSFIRKGNIPAGWDITKPHPGAPDLAVEVISPDDSAEDTTRRIRDYLKAGTEQVWVVYPESKVVYQYRRDQPSVVTVYQTGDAMNVAELFPDLAVNTRDFFILPDWVEQQQAQK